jgi:hypothetical protein
MNFNRAVFLSLLVTTQSYFMFFPSWPSAGLAALGIAGYAAAGIFNLWEDATRRMTTSLAEANARAERNEENMKKLVEAGLRMEVKVNELEHRMTLDGVGRFAGIKR